MHAFHHSQEISIDHVVSQRARLEPSTRGRAHFRCTVYLLGWYRSRLRDIRIHNRTDLLGYEGCRFRPAAK